MPIFVVKQIDEHMIYDFLNLIKNAKKRDINIAERDIVFVLLNELLGEQKIAYELAQAKVIRQSQNSGGYASRDAKTEKTAYIKKEIAPILEKLSTQLYNKYHPFDQKTSNVPVEVDELDEVERIGRTDAEVTDESLKRILLGLVRESSSETVKIQALKTLIDRFEIESENKNDNQHIIKLPPKSPLVCQYCKREV